MVSAARHLNSNKNYYANYSRVHVANRKRCLNYGQIDIISMEFLAQITDTPFRGLRRHLA